VIGIDLMPGGLIAALAAADVITNQLAIRATAHTRQYRLYTMAAGINTTGAIASVFAVITEGGVLWGVAAILFGLNILICAGNGWMAYEKAAMDAAEADAAARPPRPLHQMTPLDYTPTKETNR